GTGCRRRPLPRGRRPRRRRRRSAVRPALRARHLLPDHAARPPTGPRRHRRRADGRAARGAWWGRGGGGGVGGAAVAGPVRSPGVAGSPCARRRCARRVRAVVALVVRWTLAPGAAEVPLRAPGRRRRRRPLVPRGRAPAPIVLPGAARSFVARAPGRRRRRRPLVPRGGAPAPVVLPWRLVAGSSAPPAGAAVGGRSCLAAAFRLPSSCRGASSQAPRRPRQAPPSAAARASRPRSGSHRPAVAPRRRLLGAPG